MPEIIVYPFQLEDIKLGNDPNLVEVVKDFLDAMQTHLEKQIETPSTKVDFLSLGAHIRAEIDVLQVSFFHVYFLKYLCFIVQPKSVKLGSQFFEAC